MILFKKASDINAHLSELKRNDSSIGFVPTMGALHAGHISLINSCREKNNITVCSIFVNPTQFNDTKDFENYPSTLEEDINMLEKSGCDLLFLPDMSEIYPDGTKNTPAYDLGYLETVLEGKFRPGHFQGVCKVVHQLLQIIPCNELFIGQKDYQQCMVIKRLIESANIHSKIIICPTLREADGLAMSSRNMRLTEANRKAALQIFETLLYLKDNLSAGDLSSLLAKANAKLSSAGFKIDYVSIANADNLQLITEWDGQTKTVAVIAAFLGDVRLIDNMLLNSN